MLSKNNRKLQEHKLEQKQRFGFRKYSFGLASALIGVSFMLTTGGTVSADATTPASPKQTTLTGKQTPAPSKTVTANLLPQTGADEEKASLLSALGLGLVTLTSLFGLLGGKKRKH